MVPIDGHSFAQATLFWIWVNAMTHSHSLNCVVGNAHIKILLNNHALMIPKDPSACL